MDEKLVKLSLKNRIALLNILPHEGNIITLRIIRDLQKTLSFSEAEISDYGITMTQINDNVQTNWNAAGNKAFKNVKIGENAESIIVEKLKELNEKKQLRMSLLDLYERFVEKKENAELKAKPNKEKSME